MVLIGSRQPLRHDAAALRARMAQEPYRTALSQSWRVTTVEGLLGHHMARPGIGAAIAASGRDFLNTDDLTLIEFGFARSLSTPVKFDSNDIVELARGAKQDMPAVQGEVDWQRAELERELIAVVDGEAPRITSAMNHDSTQRIIAFQHYLKGEFAEALQAFREQPGDPKGPMELAMLGEITADVADAAAEVWAEQLRGTHPAEADAVMARLRYVQNRPEDATRYVLATIAALENDPWPWLGPAYRTLKLAESLSVRTPALANTFFDALKKPRSTWVLNEYREDTLTVLAKQLDIKVRCRELFDMLGPHVSWDESTLTYRRDCYRAIGHPGLANAETDLDEYLRYEPVPFSRLVAIP